MKTFSLIFFFFVSTVICNSQVSQQWVQRYNGPGNQTDQISDMVIDDSGNVYVTGLSSLSAANYDYATIKYNSAGVQQWLQRYNGAANGEDAGRSIAVDKSGNVYVTGSSTGSSSGLDFLTIKYSPSGIELWTQRFNGTSNGNDIAYSCAVDDSAYVYVAGGCLDSISGTNFTVIKYNSEGAQQWIKKYNGTGNSTDEAKGIFVDKQRNVYVTGNSIGTTSGDDYATIKYSQSGVELWAIRYNGTGNAADIPTGITVSNTGNVYITGRSIGSGSLEDYATIKYNSSGVEQWVQRYNGPGNSTDYCNAVKIDTLENVYVTGTSKGSGGTEDFATIKYNSDGTQQWLKRYEGVLYDYSHSIDLDAYGNIYVTGESAPGGPSVNYNYYTIKYNNSGTQQWTISYNGTGNSNDLGVAIAVNRNGDAVYVSGISRGSNFYDDYTTIKYSSVTSLTNLNIQVPANFYLEQNYPNPFNPSTHIKFQIPENGFVSLKVFDILGKEVSDLLNQNLDAGSYILNWDAANQQSGVYFYKLVSKNYSETKKMILQK